MSKMVTMLHRVWLFSHQWSVLPVQTSIKRASSTGPTTSSAPATWSGTQYWVILQFRFRFLNPFWFQILYLIWTGGRAGVWLTICRYRDRWFNLRLWCVYEKSDASKFCQTSLRWGHQTYICGVTSQVLLFSHWVSLKTEQVIHWWMTWRVCFTVSLIC